MQPIHGRVRSAARLHRLDAACRRIHHLRPNALILEHTGSVHLTAWFQASHAHLVALGSTHEPYLAALGPFYVGAPQSLGVFVPRAKRVVRVCLLDSRLIEGFEMLLTLVLD